MRLLHFLRHLVPFDAIVLPFAVPDPQRSELGYYVADLVILLATFSIVLVRAGSVCSIAKRSRDQVGGFSRLLGGFCGHQFCFQLLEK